MEHIEIILKFLRFAMPWIAGGGLIALGLLLFSKIVHYSPHLLRSFQRLRRRCRETSSNRPHLREHLERFNILREQQDLFHAVLDSACRVVDAEGASLLVRDEKGIFHMKAVFQARPMAFEIPATDCFFAFLEERRGVVTKGMVCRDATWVEMKNEALRYFVEMGADASLPIFFGEKLAAILNLGPRIGSKYYNVASRETLELLGVQYAMAIQNAMLHQELLKQNRHLKEVSILKHQILANFSHELRTPLNAIIGLSDLMAEGIEGPVNEEQQKHLVNIKGAGLRLLELVSSMLDLSKIESNQMALDVQKIDLRKLIESVVGVLPLKGSTQVSVELDSTTPGVYGDEERLRLVFKHLLENAAKFTPQGRISVQAEKRGEMLRICVVDTGIGIARNKQRKIFEVFQQVDGSATREYQGLGVGLSISRRIIELHGGRLWLASRLGRGSRFYFTLPIKPVILNQQEHPLARAG